MYNITLHHESRIAKATLEAEIAELEKKLQKRKQALDTFSAYYGETVPAVSDEHRTIRKEFLNKEANKKLDLDLLLRVKIDSSRRWNLWEALDIVESGYNRTHSIDWQLDVVQIAKLADAGAPITPFNIMCTRYEKAEQIFSILYVPNLNPPAL